MTLRPQDEIAIINAVKRCVAAVEQGYEYNRWPLLQEYLRDEVLTK